MEALQIICPLCSDPVDKLLYRYHLDSERNVLEKIKLHNPEWTENDGACSRCIDYYHTEVIMQQRVLPGIGPHFPVRSVDDFIILPTGLRLDADQRFTGKGVTICFIDSGFYVHPDLSTYRNRIKKIIDIAGDTIANDESIPSNSAWHGTMTSVVCAGDGFCSKGLYKGIASDADLVLLKVQDANGRITTANIVKALDWVVAHHKEYGIRIVNMSLGGDEVVSYKESEIDQLAEQLVAEGVVIVAAAGNDEHGMIKPPANSPAVITVGGADDENNLQPLPAKLYHSAYGTTIDELAKPELLAHAIWLAAPILPGTKEQKESEILHYLSGLRDEDLVAEFVVQYKATGFEGLLPDNQDPVLLRQSIISRIQACKFISPYYMHVDGTSFAAPIVSAVIAQLLEINPQLTVAMIREILFCTAKRIEHLPAERQGFGLIRPRNATLKVLKREMIASHGESPRINIHSKTIEFYLQHDCATQVSLAGTFNSWAKDALLLEAGKDGVWKIAIPLLPAGRYHYKFFVNDTAWLEDVNNPYREPDGFNGFNSILIINN